MNSGIVPISRYPLIFTKLNHIFIFTEWWCTWARCRTPSTWALSRSVACAISRICPFKEMKIGFIFKISLVKGSFYWCVSRSWNIWLNQWLFHQRNEFLEHGEVFSHLKSPKHFQISKGKTEKMGHRQADNGHIKVGCTMHDVGNKIRNVCYTVSHVSYNTHKVCLRLRALGKIPTLHSF